MNYKSVKQSFDLSNKIAVITGGAGLLGIKHAETIAELGGIPWIIDIKQDRIDHAIQHIEKTFKQKAFGQVVDITSQEQVGQLCKDILSNHENIDILINNAANNPKMEDQDESKNWSRFENFPIEIWNQDIQVGLTGAFICSQTFGHEMSKSKGGVILNIASDLGLIAPDQRIYRNQGETSENQNVKPVTYSVVKAGLIGLTKYLATYWPDKVRSNALAPGGIYAGQDDDFVQRLTNLIPMGRMANQDEYKSAIAFMVSEASSYMNGSVISMDGGRTVW